ncbi:hypothetical protein HPB47_019010 [Ixodes persulcatus]|uniref:Uncharacterized protein n=1 Tax=Ixodes persulcatus TaxID=34615 RepID=A0AC60QMX9_IXOPE|nr:hypothetical protein HPB47_019010 [Ixodes persulcatus]
MPCDQTNQSSTPRSTVKNNINIRTTWSGQETTGTARNGPKASSSEFYETAANLGREWSSSPGSVNPGELNPGKTSPQRQYDESWTVIRRRQRVLDAVSHPGSTPPPSPATSPTASSATKSSTGLDPARGRPRHRAPPAERLSEDHVKVVLRLRGGLNLSTVSPTTLADCVTQAAQLTSESRDRILRARKLCSVNAILVKGKQYEFAAHVSAPANTTVLIKSNPDLPILAAKPTYRCNPYRHKTEACTECWQKGHRRDVCPHQIIRCAICGLENPNDNYPCTPRCVVCGGPHLMGTPECPKRFQPRRRQPSQATPPSTSAWARGPPGTEKPPPNTDDAKHWPTLPDRGRSASKSPAGARRTTRSPSINRSRRPSTDRGRSSHGPARNTRRASSRNQVDHSQPFYIHSPYAPPPPQIPQAVATELAKFRTEMAAFQKENQNLFRELKASRHEIQTTIQENQNLKASMHTQAPSRHQPQKSGATTTQPEDEDTTPDASRSSGEPDSKYSKMEQDIFLIREGCVNLEANIDNKVANAIQTAMESSLSGLLKEFESRVAKAYKDAIRGSRSRNASPGAPQHELTHPTPTGYKRKRANLQLLVQNAESPPDIIALQEVETQVKLYVQSYQGKENGKTAVLVHRNIPASRHQFDSIDIPHDLVTVYLPKRGGTKVCILNVCSSPNNQGRTHRFNQLFSLARIEAGPHALLIVGDFNATHTSWGYHELQSQRQRPLATDTFTSPHIRDQPNSTHTHRQQCSKRHNTRSHPLITNQPAHEHAAEGCQRSHQRARPEYSIGNDSNILKKWRKNKHNRKLKNKLSQLERQITSRASSLVRDQWGQICDEMRGNLGLEKTWILLGQPPDPDQGKSEQKNRMTKLCTPSYPGQQNTNMDREIEEAEVRLAISKLKPNSAPGLDGITNRPLRNLDDSYITDMTDYINTCWREGKIPESWKHAKVILIPKPGKPLTLEHLIPISLTSCLGKLMEHIILDRLTNHMNDADLFPHTMVGFRAGLSTQDILLQLSEQIIKSTGNFDTAAILALDLTKDIRQLNPGDKTYNYIKAFLSGRTAVINIGDLTSDTTQLGSRGTPQGAVLSPILFNLAVINILKRLGQIPQLRHKLGSDAHIEETPQQGVEIVAEEAERAGLACFPAKSQLILLRPPNTRKQNNADIELHINGRPIPVRIESQINQTIGLLKRVTNKHKGLNEQDRIRILQAFVLSRLTYWTPYRHVSRGGGAHGARAPPPKAYKIALRLPPSTPTANPEGLGLHNHLDELIEAHRATQLTRLSRTPTGRHILASLNIVCHKLLQDKSPIRPNIHNKIIANPLPQNRAISLQRTYEDNPGVLYVDAAEYRHHGAFTAAVTDNLHSPIDAVTVLTTDPETAEEVAIALAFTVIPTPSVILTDSKTALRNFAAGRISKLLWTPAHAGLEGNEAAHEQARGYTIRARPTLLKKPILTTHYLLSRQVYPQTDQSLTREQAHSWRQLQTGTFLTPLSSPRSSPHYKATLPHIIWACPQDPFPSIPSHDEWETSLRSSDPEVQSALVERAKEVAATTRTAL